MKKPYFAWVDSGTAFDSVLHKVEDEVAISIVITHEEGNFPTADVVVKGPQLTLLSSLRKQWVMISEDVAGVAVFRFTGRIVGVPTDLTAELVTLKFTAEPEDYAEQKHAVGTTLKTTDQYDGLFLDITKRDDPDAILEAYSSRWHISRDLVVSVSDVLTGEDGIEVFTDDEVPYENFQLTVGTPPITTVNFTASVQWSQASTGTIDVGTWNWKVFAGEGLISGWMKEGASLGGGWFVDSAPIVDRAHNSEATSTTINFNYTNKEKTHAFGDTMSVNSSDTFTVGGNVAISQQYNTSVQAGQISEDPDFHDIQPAFLKYNTFQIFQYDIVASLRLRYEAGRDRVERIRGTMVSDIQSIVTLSPASKAASVDLNLDGADVALAILAYDFITGAALTPEPPPIIDPQKNTYFTGLRGQQSIRYVLSCCRAILRAAARCVELQMDIPWERVVNLSLRKSATITERRAGTVQGKITKYVMTWDGPTGTMKGNITVGIPIGRGGTAYVATGDGVYAAPGYMAPGYQFMENNFVPIGAIPDITYSIPAAATTDDGLKFPLTLNDVLLSLSVSQQDDTSIQAVISAAISSAIASALGDTNPQAAAQLAAAKAAKASADAAMVNIGDWFNMQLIDVSKQGFEASYVLTVSNLAIETGINMGDVLPPTLPPTPTGGGTPPPAPSILSVDTL